MRCTAVRMSIVCVELTARLEIQAYSKSLFVNEYDGTVEKSDEKTSHAWMHKTSISASVSQTPFGVLVEIATHSQPIPYRPFFFISQKYLELRWTT